MHGARNGHRVQCTHDGITPENRYLVHASPNEPNLFLAVDSHILWIVTCLDEDDIPFLRGIHRFLKRAVIPRPI